MVQRQLPSHHPDEEFLRDYASGSVMGARALIAATHLTYCADCRARVALAEAVGGELLDQETGIETGAPKPIPPAYELDVPANACPENFSEMPAPLREVLGAPAGRWVNVWFGVKELPVPGFAPEARLLWIPAGRRMPRHDHYGEEMTLVLKGSFSDATGVYRPGDLQIGAPGLDHQPHAGSEGPCVCLVVEQGGLKLSGWLGKLVEWRGGKARTSVAA